MPEELAGRAVLVSGHHGYRSVDGDRVIMDGSGGRPQRPLEAIVLPSKEVVSSDDRDIDFRS